MKAVQSVVATVAVATAAILSLAPHVAQAQSVDVAHRIAVLETKVEALEVAVDRNRVAIAKNGEAIARLDKKVDALRADMDIRFAVLEEKMNGLQMQNQFIIIPLMLLMLASLLGLLTRGILWDRADRPQSTRRAGDSPLQPAATRV